jgi:hypothetical protein
LLLLVVLVRVVVVHVEGVEDVVEVAPGAAVGLVVALWGVLFSVEVVDLLLSWVVLRRDVDVVLDGGVDGLWLVVGVLVLVVVGDSVRLGSVWDVDWGGGLWEDVSEGELVESEFRLSLVSVNDSGIALSSNIRAVAVVTDDSVDSFVVVVIVVVNVVVFLLVVGVVLLLVV